MATGPSRASRGNRVYRGFVPSASPYSRVCPDCAADVGMDCFNLKRTLYPVTMKSVHQARRRQQKNPNPNPRKTTEGCDDAGEQGESPGDLGGPVVPLLP